MNDTWTPERLAWASGLIEGEGCITRQITTKRSKQYNYWQLKVASTDKDVLEKLASIIGFGSIYSQKVYKKHYKEAWQYKIYRQPDLYKVLKAILPFMCSRRTSRIEEALKEMSEKGGWQSSRRPVPKTDWGYKLKEGIKDFS